MIWKEKYRLGASEIDVNNVGSPSALLRYMQDTANCHMEAAGPSYDELIARGMSFVLSRITVSFGVPLFAHDKFESETFAVPSRGAAFGRCYRLTRGEEIVALADSAWALVNIADHTLVKVSDVELRYGEEEPIDIGVPTRFHIPRNISLERVGEYTVTYSDTDLNGHMNNTRYPDLLCGFAADMRGHRAEMISINFVSEAPMGETLTVYSGTDGDRIFVRTVRRDGKINTEAAITLCEFCT